SCSWVVFPELATTSFFPYFFFSSKTKDKLNAFFDGEDITKGLIGEIFKQAKLSQIAVSFGYAEQTADGKKYNTFVTIDAKSRIFKYRKTHLPGFEKIDPNIKNFQYEKAIFDESDEGYPAYDIDILNTDGKIEKVRIGMIICHDRRYNAPYLTLGQKGCQVLINGYNTPFDLTYAQELNDHVYEFHYLPQRAQAITEGMYIISSAIAGENFGIRQIGGSCILSPYGDFIEKLDHDNEQIIYGIIDTKQCSEVKKQKYNGKRARYEILLAETIEYSDLDTIISKINEKYGTHLTKSLVLKNKGIRSNDEYHSTWINKANTIFNSLS
ncbi:hypothetical protein KC909_06760, partial [Candidatus Dojkabacteria bacterium]|nr:hypothetical protein [Candidatus Dojkabacteria bacterium]